MGSSTSTYMAFVRAAVLRLGSGMPGNLPPMFTTRSTAKGPRSPQKPMEPLPSSRSLTAVAIGGRACLGFRKKTLQRTWFILGKGLEIPCPADRRGRAVVEICFGDHVLNVDRRELRRGTEMIAVEPQVLRSLGLSGPEPRSRRQQGRPDCEGLGRPDRLGVDANQPHPCRAEGGR